MPDQEPASSPSRKKSMSGPSLPTPAMGLDLPAWSERPQIFESLRPPPRIGDGPRAKPKLHDPGAEFCWPMHFGFEPDYSTWPHGIQGPRPGTSVLQDDFNETKPVSYGMCYPAVVH